MKFLSRIAAAALFASVVVLSASPASAQFGVRAGYSFSPDQVVLGAHYMIPLGASGLHFVPSAEVAFGDDAFTMYGNGDLIFRFAAGGSVKPYLGGGASVVNIDPDDIEVNGVTTKGESNTEVGFSALGGAWFNAGGSTPWFIEGKVGLDDKVPDVKVMVGVGL
jgi:hypothetical protein